MTQTSTFRYQFRTLPGHMYSPAQERETESMCSPFVLQQMTLTFGGGGSPLAAGDYVVTFVTPASGSIVVTVNSDGTKTYAEGTTELAGLIAANPNLSPLFTVSNNGATTVTLVARSALLSMAVPTTSVPGADTLTAAQTVAASAPSLQMGLFYVYSPVVQPLAITGTPRGVQPAALPTGSTTIADLRGIIAREVNSTTLPAFGLTSTTPDAYPAGRVWPGLLRGFVAARVDPASPTMTDSLTQQVHVVIAAGAYSIVGAVAGAADGGNTIRIDNAPTGNILARAWQREENLQPFGYSSGRFIPLKLNRTN